MIIEYVIIYFQIMRQYEIYKKSGQLLKMWQKIQQKYSKNMAKMWLNYVKCQKYIIYCQILETYYVYE